MRFWMMHHGGLTSKRSIFWGNVSTLGDLDKGVLSRAEKEKNQDQNESKLSYISMIICLSVSLYLSSELDSLLQATFGTCIVASSI